MESERWKMDGRRRVLIWRALRALEDDETPNGETEPANSDRWISFMTLAIAMLGHCRLRSSSRSGTGSDGESNSNSGNYRGRTC